MINGVILEAVKLSLFMFIKKIFIVNKMKFFWKLDKKGVTVTTIVVGTYANPVTELGYHRPITTVCDTVGCSYVASGIIHSFSKLHIDIVPSINFTPQMYQGNTIIIGGRVRNHVTQEFLDALEKKWYLPFEINDMENISPRNIYDKHSDETYTSQIDDFNMKIDYGIITRAPNPFMSKSDVTVFYGLHTYGTQGTAKMVTKYYVDNLFQVWLKIKQQPVQVLIRVKVIKNETIPEIVKVYLIRSRSPINI